MKSKKDIQREIYHFVEDSVLETGEPVILQTILNKFCKKYSTSTATITRCLDEMVSGRNPFRLRTWYDKNRYYMIPTMSRWFIIISSLSISGVLFSFFLDLVLTTSFFLLERVSYFLLGFWLMFALKYKFEAKNNKK